MILWIIAGLVMLAFFVLAYAAQTGSGNGGSIISSPRRDSLITNELHKNIRNRAVAADLSVPIIDRHFPDADDGYRVVKKLLHALVGAGYKIGDYMPFVVMPNGPSITLYVYEKGAVRSTRPVECIGFILLCANEVDLAAQFVHGVKLHQRPLPALHVRQDAARVAVFSMANEPDAEWFAQSRAILEG